MARGTWPHAACVQPRTPLAWGRLPIPGTSASLPWAPRPTPVPGPRLVPALTKLQRLHQGNVSLACSQSQVRRVSAALGDHLWTLQTTDAQASPTAATAAVGVEPLHQQSLKRLG